MATKDEINPQNVGEIVKIGSINLSNWGGFVARMAFAWIDAEGNKKYSPESKDILVGQNRTGKPDEYYVPAGSMIYLYVYVVWGNNNAAARMFIFEKDNPHCANYVITGTTLNNTLALVNITVNDDTEAKHDHHTDEPKGEEVSKW